MKLLRINTLISVALGCALTATSISASARPCASGKMYGGHHPGMGYGMYGPHAGMHYPGKAYYGHRYKNKGARYSQPMSEPAYTSTAKRDAVNEQPATTTGSQDIVSIASGSEDFETLVTAVKAAGLAETLASKGPFTVFAPTDEAFAKLPVEQLAALLADKEALTRVLTYHVIPGTVSADAASKLSSAKTVEGGTLSIDSTDGVKINGANVVKADIEASNGIIHVIDSVILPN